MRKNKLAKLSQFMMIILCLAIIGGALLSAYIRGNITFEEVALIVLGVVILIGVKCFVKRLNDIDQSHEISAMTLTRGFSHELKTPLAIIKASVENWDYLDEVDQPEYLQKMNSEIVHMEEMIQKLSKYSELNSNGISMKCVKVDLYSLTMDMLEQLSPIIKERGLKIEVNVNESTDHLVEADLEMMKMIIGNLISNAIKYADKNIMISIEENRKISYKIENDGVRISKEDSKKAWDLLYKSDKARTNRFGSTGIGLAITKSMLGLHKAKYGCEPTENGTLFWFKMKKMFEE